MSIKIRTSAFITLVSALLFATSTLAATQAQIDNARANGIAWLVQNQNGDGSWSDTDASTRMAATTESMNALRRSGAQYGHLFTRGLSWVANTKTESVDSLARKIEQLEMAGLSSEELGLMQELMAYRDVVNECWGSYDNHGCSFPDTSLAMDAILNAMITSDYTYPDDFASLDLIMSSHGQPPIVNGWSYIAGDDWARSDQKIMPSFYVMMTLLRYVAWYSYWETIDAATASDIRGNLMYGALWLLNRFTANGSFRDDGLVATGEIQSTAFAYFILDALRDYSFPFNASQLAKITSAQDFIINQQQADGSWDGDAFVTALAVRSFSKATMVDTDSDGIPDAVETVLGTNPNVADGRGYLDNNGLDPDNLQNTGLSAPPVMRETVVNQSFSHIPTVSGGTPDYYWSLLTGSLPNGVSLVSSVTGQLSGTPSYVGTQSFALQAQDAVGNNIIVPVHIRVLATNEETDSDGDGYSSAIELSLGTNPLDINSAPTVPLAVDDSGYSLDQGSTLNTSVAALPSVLANDIDSDTPNASLTAVLNTAPTNGLVALNSDGSFVYIHNGSQSLSDSFTYYINDGASNSPSPATVSIVINSVAPVTNQPPVANSDNLSTTEGNAVTANLIVNDQDADQDPLSIAAVDTLSSNGGTIMNHGDGTITYMPPAAFWGSDTFTYQVTDGSAIVSGNVTVTIAPENDIEIRVNVGGSAVIDSAGRSWAADYGFNNTGVAAGIANAIGGKETTNDAFLYQTERTTEWDSSTISYSYDVPNGDYHVILHFADTYFWLNGQRVFNVSAEGQPIFNDLDIISEVSYNAPLLERFDVSVSDGTLNIDFMPVSGIPVINAIEIIAKGIAKSAIPGKIEAEDYHAGSNGMAYHDTSAGNAGRIYRRDDVDIGITHDIDGGYKTGWTHEGEWLHYNVFVAETGFYDIDIRVSNPSEDWYWGRMKLALNGTDLTSLLIAPLTASSDQFNDATVRKVLLTTGSHTLKLIINQGGIDINWLRFTPHTSFDIPGRIEAEDYGHEGAGGAYFDTSPGNYAGWYRHDDVDIDITSDIGGGYKVAWIADHEWLQYDAKIITSGLYNIEFRVAKGDPGEATFHLEHNGIDITGPITVNGSGTYDWNLFQTISANNIALTAGPAAFKIVIGHGSIDINWLQFILIPSNSP